jgi:hypothetical protein
MTSLPNPRSNDGSTAFDLDWIRSNTTTNERGCWLWLGSLDEKGYGRVNAKGFPKRVHQCTWKLAGRTVPKPLMLDHTCKNKPCCNPDHLETVTNQENVRRGDSLRFVGGACPECGSSRLYKRRFGHACADCRKRYEQTAARVAARAEYEKFRASNAKRIEQHRAACARYNAKKRAEQLGLLGGDGK